MNFLKHGDRDFSIALLRMVDTDRAAYAVGKDHDLDNLDILDHICVVTRCCARAVSYRSHTMKICARPVPYRSPSASVICIVQIL